MKQQFTFLCLLFCALQACDTQQANLKELTAAQKEITEKDFEWLVGNWQGKVGEGDFYEHWKSSAPGEFTGAGYMLINADTVMNEQLTIRKVNGNWAYLVSIDKGAPVSFLLTDSALANSVVFENRANDFPKQIVYTQQPDGSLLAVISGPFQGKKQSQEFRLQRINAVAATGK